MSGDRLGEHVPTEGAQQEIRQQPFLHYWPSPDTEPLVYDISADQAFAVAVAATAVRFRRPSLSYEEIVNPPAEGGKPQVKAANILLLGLLNNSSLPYGYLRHKLPGHKKDSDAQVERFLNAATSRIGEAPELRDRFARVQESFRGQLAKENGGEAAQTKRRSRKSRAKQA